MGRGLAVVLLVSLSAVEPVGAQRPRVPQAAPPAKLAEAYHKFLLGHRLEESGDIAGAIAAYEQATELDPLAAAIPAELAGLYLRQNRPQEAITAAELALKVAPANPEANRVLGMVYAALVDEARGGRGDLRRGGVRIVDETNVKKAIDHLELALANPIGDADPNVRATLARLHMRTATYDKAIALLADLVNEQPEWPEGPVLLAESYAGAGRTREAIEWLQERASDDPRLLPTLADFYERDRRWMDAANAYERALQRTPRSPELRTRYASALLNAGGRANVGKARDALREVVSTRATDGRALYLLSQAELRMGDVTAAEAAARRLIASQNGSSPWGYYALAEALEKRRAYKAIVEALAPALANFRAQPDETLSLRLLLPHVGFAHQELDEYDKAIAAFDEAHRLSPADPAITAYLIEANIGAKKYAAAADLAKTARAERPDDLRLARLEAQALRRNGNVDQGIAVLEDVVKRNADRPSAHIALAELYSDAARGGEAIRVLENARVKFPADDSIVFELGAAFDKQKRFAEAEAAFRQLIARDPDNAAALNYLGYILAERGDRLDESVNFLKRAVQMEPENGSFLDSLGWAYFKSDKLDLAEPNLRRAADQLQKNSVIQDHYGDLLFKLGRYDEAIAAWTRSLAGDRDSISPSDIDKKISAARQKLEKK